jgi:quinol monooxygenase YgiN
MAVGAACISLTLVWTCAAAEARDENPIVASVRSKLKDPGKPFTLLVTLRVKEGMGSKLEAAFAKATGPTHKEKGCVAYDLNRDAEKPDHYVLYERWKSLADLESHLKADHTRALLDEIHDLTAAQPELQVLIPAGE